jgi:hypothetical protein
MLDGAGSAIEVMVYADVAMTHLVDWPARIALAAYRRALREQRERAA